MKLTPEQWIERKTVKKTVKALPALPNSHSKRIACLSGRGCGNMVSANVGICRSCRRAGKLHARRIEAKTRKAQKYLAE